MQLVGLLTHDRLAVLVFALIEWSFVLLYVYCLMRFKENGPLKLVAAALALSASVVAVIVDRRIYDAVSFGSSLLNEFDAVVIVEKCVSLLILFSGLWKLRSGGTGRDHFKAP